VIRDCQAVGRFEGRDVDYLSFTIWSAMHGMCALYCRERCQAYENVDALTLMDEGYKNLISMMAQI
jgi:hypothetical protein